MRTTLALVGILVFYIAAHLLGNAVVGGFKAGLRFVDWVVAYLAKSIRNLITTEKHEAGRLPHDDNTPIEPR